MAALGGACGGRVPIPPPAANGPCVERCQANHAICIQSTNHATGYGDGGAALVGGLISLAMASSARSQCADVLRDCYATCGQAITPQQASLADYCAQIRCPDGSPGLWVGRATSLGLSVGVVAYMCKTVERQVVGQWSCSQIQVGVGCITEGGVLQGTVTQAQDSIEIVSSPLPGGRVSSCEFTGHLVGLTMTGPYSCSGAVGTVNGSFELTRCP